MPSELEFQLNVIKHSIALLKAAFWLFTVAAVTAAAMLCLKPQVSRIEWVYWKFQHTDLRQNLT